MKGKYTITILLFIALTAVCVYSVAQTRQPTLQQRVEILEKQVKQLTGRIEKLETEINPGLELKKEGKSSRIFFPLSVGQIVYFDVDDKINVVQVVDSNNMIVELLIREVRKYPNYTVLEPVKQMAWIQNYKTTNIVDEKKIIPPPNLLFKIIGTKTYETAIGGTQTVFLLEPIK